MNEQGTGTIRRTETLIASFVAAVLSMTLASEARAGTYVAWECGGANGGPGGIPDVRGPFGSASLTAHNSCSGGGGEYGVVSFDAWNTNGSYLAYEVFAPNGTRFLNGYADVAIANRGNYQGYVSIGNGSGHSNHVATDTWGFWTGAEWVGQSDTNQFTVWLYCPVICGPGEGPGSGHAYAYARNLIFNVQDYSPPGASLSGSLTGGAWRNSGGNLTVHGTDQGSGVHTLETHVNGSRVDNASANCTLTSLFGGTAGDRLTPCPNNTSRSGSYGVGSFQQGANTVTGCVRDFASDGNPNEVCTSATVRMDTVAPETPSGFTVAGGEAWRPTNDFDVSWSNAAQAHAPIEGAMYRISRNGGGYDSGAQFVSGTNRQSLDNLSVPSPGEYTLRVWTRDAAGNHSEENARTATLRFDPTVPPDAEAEFNGWIRRNDFTYVATWDQVPAGRLGPSGLDGYAVSVTRDPTSDPCMKEGGPSCSGE